MRYFSIISAAAVIPSVDEAWAGEIPASMRRRDPRIWHMAHVAVARCIAKSQSHPASILTATALGALDETKNFLDGIYSDGFGSPKNFIASVHNGMAGKLSLDLKIPGPNLTLCDGPNSFASAIAACECLYASDFPVLVVAVDESVELLDRLSPHLSEPCRRVIAGSKREGAIAFILSDTLAGGYPRIGSTGPLFIGNVKPDEAFNNNIPNAGGTPTVIMPTEAGGGFIAAAVGAFDFIADPRRARTVIGSFSPSSKSISLIDLCP